MEVEPLFARTAKLIRFEFFMGTGSASRVRALFPVSSSQRVFRLLSRNSSMIVDRVQGILMLNCTNAHMSSSSSSYQVPRRLTKDCSK